MGNCMVTRRRILFQTRKCKSATKAGPDGQISRSTSFSNRAMSSKLEMTTRSLDHTVFEKRTNDENHEPKSGAARVMRIRVVVTQSQLSQIMKESKNLASLSPSSAAVKQMSLARAITMSSIEHSLSTRNDQGGSIKGKWRPRLKSIVEE